MAIQCSDLCRINGLEGLVQIAGTDENNRQIKWVCKVDSIERVETITDSLQNGDIIIVSGNNLIQNKELISQFIEEANKYKAAGIIICNTNQQPNMMSFEELKHLEHIKFPIFSLIMDKEAEKKIFKDICRAIIVDSLNENAKKNILQSIIMNDNLEDGFVEECLRSYGININDLNQIGIFKFLGLSDSTKKSPLEDGISIQETALELEKSIRNIFLANCPPRNVITAINNDSVVFLTFSFDDNDEIENIMFKIHEDFTDRLPGAILNFGLGFAYSGLLGIYKSYQEALQIMKLKKIEGLHSNPFSLKNMDVYLFLIGLKERKVMENFIVKVLNLLITHDKQNQTELIETLDIYLNENLNAAKSSEKLFIHKNTLKYRLKKIENILNVNLHSTEDCLKLLLAIKTFKILKMSTEE